MFTRLSFEISVLTPVHIGTGQVLRRDLDFVVVERRFCRLREEAVLEHLAAAKAQELEHLLLRTPPGQLLTPQDLPPGSPLIRYELQGDVGGNEVRELVKDARDRPYIPGSSFKGAIRTLLAWHGWRDLNLSIRTTGLAKGPGPGARKKGLAGPVEKEIFGQNPNRDLLRAFRPADSSPSDTKALRAYEARVWGKRGPAAPLFLEGIRPGTRFSLQAVFDELLFQRWWKGKVEEAGFPFKHREWFERLGELARARASERTKTEQEWFSRAQGLKMPPVYAFLQDKLREGGSGFPLQVGFGTGWLGTTIGAPLKEDPDWARLFEHLPKGRAQDPKGFPTSRRLVSHEGSHLPLGWVWVQVKEAT